MPSGGARPGAGRPRAQAPKANPRDGYKRKTIGPPGKGRQVAEHRAVAGVTKAGPNTTVDHRDNNPSNNTRSNLKVMPRGANTSKANRRRAK